MPWGKNPQRSDSKPPAISKVSANIIVSIFHLCLTFLYSKNVPIKGHGVGPQMPIFLKKPYGAYPYLRIKSRIRKPRPSNPSVIKKAILLRIFHQGIFLPCFVFTQIFFYIAVSFIVLFMIKNMDFYCNFCCYLVFCFTKTRFIPVIIYPHNRIL